MHLLGLSFSLPSSSKDIGIRLFIATVFAILIAFLAKSTIEGLRKGHILAGSGPTARSYSRNGQPIRFWITVFLNLAFCAGFLVCIPLVLFGRRAT